MSENKQTALDRLFNVEPPGFRLSKPSLFGAVYSAFEVPDEPAVVHTSWLTSESAREVRPASD